MMMISF